MFSFFSSSKAKALDGKKRFSKAKALDGKKRLSKAILNAVINDRGLQFFFKKL
jgi:hypothetical protein